MSGSVNKHIIVGNVGKDPEVRTTQSGGRVATLSVATSENWKDKESGERQERTHWHTVVIFNDAVAGIVEKHVKKGDKVYAEGSVETRKWQDKDGRDRYSTETVIRPFNGEFHMLGSAKGPG